MLMEICVNFVFFEQIRFFFIKKFKPLGLLCNKFVTCNQKLKTHGMFGWQSKYFKGNWARSEPKREPYIAYIRIWECPRIHIIHITIVILFMSIGDIDFCNTCCWTQAHIGTSWVPKQKWKSAALSKSSKFRFLSVSTFKATSSKLFGWFNVWQLAKMKKSIPDMSLPWI